MGVAHFAKQQIKQVSMTVSRIKQKLQNFFQPKLPAVACEITRQFISVVRLNSKTPPEIDRFAVESIPHGLVNPSLTRPIITSASDLMNALKSTFAKAEIKTSKISLAIPDACAKVTIHHFDSLPGNENERIQLLKWRLKKTVPFNVDDSQLSYLVQKTEGKYVIVTANIYKEVLVQLEGFFDSLGIQVGYITLASFAAFELLARLDVDVLQKSVLFLRVRPSDVSSLIVQQGAMVFFRHVDYESDEDSTPAEDSAATKSGFTEIYNEIHPCLMYYQDKLGARGIEKIYISPFRPLDPGLLSSISEKAKTPVLSLDPLRLFQWRQSGSLANVKNVLAPTLGLALGRS